jgi:hypothetical protein
MEYGNPFSLPTDEEIFRMRDEEHLRKRQERERLSQLKVHQKTTASSRMGGNMLRVRDEQQNMNDEITSKQAKHTRGLVAAATAAISNDRRREKENMTDFIAKKREMFLVQMSLDTKREEIRKLEEKAQMKEEALKKSELMLEEDAVRFDTFLKENDKKAHEAMKRAENETKAKQDKVQEIKKLNQMIQMIQSDMSKQEEQLLDCIKHKKFLDNLTPGEWFEECKAVKKRRQMDRLKQRQDQKLKEWEESCNKARAEAESKERAERERLEKEGKVKKKNEKNAAKALHLPPKPNFDNDTLTSSEEEMPMYFTEPARLLDLFTALEESNLFLIQNSQETEQALEELKQEFRETKKTMDAKRDALKTNIDTLRQELMSMESAADSLQARANTKTGGEDVQGVLLKKLHVKVLEVYRQCGFDADSNPNTLFMLTDLEARLEDLRKEIEQMPEEECQKALKDKEKERRDRVRQERMAEQQKMYEERMKKSLERSMQAPKKRKGRQVMWRSKPMRKAVQSERKDDGGGDDADAQFFT